MEGPLGMIKVAHESVASTRAEVEALARRLLALRSDIDEILVGLAASRAPVAAAEARSAAAPVEEAVTVSPQQTADHLAPDDLALIRPIDAALAEGLHRLGIIAFAQIADWSRRDVMRVSKVLGLGRRISKENWIEQAAMLASGRTTAFAGRRSAYTARSIWEAAPARERSDAADVLAPEAAVRAPTSAENGTSRTAHLEPAPVVATTPCERSAPLVPVLSLAPYRGIPKLPRALTKAPPRTHRGLVLAMKLAACLMALIVAGSVMVDRGGAWGGAAADNKGLRTPRAGVAAGDQPVRAVLWPGACSRARASCL
jgi:predicted flap endonuclease-1-like 5' DNA nuclease